jgi:hypothetical protein
MPRDPTECREQANACLRMAGKAQRRQDREVLKNLARTWLHLALEVERSAALLKECSAPITKKSSRAA